MTARMRASFEGDFLNWPEHHPAENVLKTSPNSLIGSQQTIFEELKSATQANLGAFDVLAGKLSELVSRLEPFGEAILTAESRPSLKSENQFFMGHKVSPYDTLSRTHGDMSPDKHEETPRRTIQISKMRSVEGSSFPGFSVSELPELPNKLEAPHILNRVTDAHEFKAGFKQLWKKAFLSEASCAFLRDSFWWFFIELFETERREEQRLLFTRMADSFSTLFLSVHPDLKEKFFQLYSVCVSQSLFAAFYDGFPESTHHLDTAFQQQLVDTVSLWVSGVRAAPGAHRQWPIKKMVSQLRSTDTLVQESKDTAPSSHPPAEKPTTAGQGSVPSESGIPTRALSPETTLQRVLFDMRGRSVLVSHYLQAHGLHSEVSPQTLKRTQLVIGGPQPEAVLPHATHSKDAATTEKRTETEPERVDGEQ